MGLPGAAIRDHFRQNLVGYIALFIVLGGTAVALPGKNKVDTGDIKRNAVRTSDIARKAVNAPKIAPRSVDSLKVIDDSLGGVDIDESTLNIRPAPSSIGPAELADRERRLIFSAGTLVPGEASQPTPGNAHVLATLSYPPGSESLAYLSTEVPGGRIEGTDLTVRLIWTANGSGVVSWGIQYLSVRTGDSIPLQQGKSSTTSSATDEVVTATSFTIPGSDVQNGQVLGMAVRRLGQETSDTLLQPARLHMVEIDYTANG